MENAAFETSFTERSTAHTAAKRRIAGEALNDLGEAETVFSDAGRTGC
ncbi:hypothetical protein [Streptomyces sp. CA-111067]